MSEWKCGNCGKIYNFNEFLALDKVKIVESDTEPWKQHGYTPICKCGYRFHLDRWRLNDNLKIKINDSKRDILVSTIDLEMNHGFIENEELWYETMIFIEDVEGKDKIKYYYEKRYKTKDDGIKDHERIVNLIKEGKFEIEDEDDQKILILHNREADI